MRVTLITRPTSEILRQRGLCEGGITQKYIDNTVLRLNKKYIPLRSGTLAKSGKLNTIIGSGKVVYDTRYARWQYYHNQGRGNEGTARGGLRGRLWFERMKAARKNEILRGAARISGGHAER